jgi:hypothetical protein
MAQMIVILPHNRAENWRRSQLKPTAGAINPGGPRHATRGYRYGSSLVRGTHGDTQVPPDGQ